MWQHIGGFGLSLVRSVFLEWERKEISFPWLGTRPRVPASQLLVKNLASYASWTLSTSHLQYNSTICLSPPSTALTAMPLKRKKTSLIEEAALEELTTKMAKRATLKVEDPEMKLSKAKKNGGSYSGLNIFNPVCPGRPGRGLTLAYLHLDCVCLRRRVTPRIILSAIFWLP